MRFVKKDFSADSSVVKEVEELLSGATTSTEVETAEMRVPKTLTRDLDTGQVREHRCENTEDGGSNPSQRTISKIKSFQLRWREPLGDIQCPYAYRTIFNLGLFSIRIHEWKRSDDKRYFHDHPWWFITFLIKGSYTDVSVNGRDKLKVGSIRFRPAKYQHYVEVPKTGAITILLTGSKTRNWGYWVKNKFNRASRYFGKYGHPPCFEQ